MKYIALSTFIIIQILFLPLTIIGIILLGYKQLTVSKKLDISATALSALGGRVIANYLGTRKDEMAGKLYASLPNASIVGFWLFLFPTYIRYKIYPAKVEPGKESIISIVNSIPAIRSIYFDKIIARQINKAEQFVIMGAGFDTHSYGELKNSFKFFELDKLNTQKVKRESLKKAFINSDNVTFVDVDFTTESWYEKLEKSGYSASKKTLFLWEGVTLYLQESDVRKTIKEIKKHATKGSVLATDFYAKRIFTLYKGVKSTKEMLHFTLDFSSNAELVLKSFVESENLTLGDFYFMGKAGNKGAIGVVSELII